MEKKVVVITGSSSGIGKAAVDEFARRGYRVYATMRTPEKAPEYVRGEIRLKKLDVTNDQNVHEVIQEILQKEGKIDILVNNAGYGLVGPVEETTMEEIKKQFDVNLFGVIRLLHEVLPAMRTRKSGHIVNISSIVGVVSNAALGIYSATKFALESISASLAATVFPWNIKVTVIEPGPVHTEFGQSITVGHRLGDESPYSSFVKKYLSEMRGNLVEGQDPTEVAKLVVDVTDMENPHFRYQTHQRVTERVEEFIADPSGNTWLKEQKELFADWFS